MGARAPIRETAGVELSGEQNQTTRYEPFASFDEWLTLRVNESLWDASFARLRASLPDRPEPPVDPSFRRSLIAAAALNSGAIEGLHGAGRGLTRSVIEQATDWQPIVRHAEGSKAEAFVAASIEGFDMALDIATGADPFSEVWIRSVHAVVCAPQDTVRVFAEVDGQRLQSDVPFEKGAYKTRPNNVELSDGSVHWYCPAEEVSIEMGRLVETLRSPVFASAHPILQTAFAHYAFVAVHPFQDGNGRVARVLASTFLLRAASIPLFIYDDERVPYFDALEAADLGDRQAFVAFIERVALETLAYASDLAGTPDGPLRVSQPSERIAKDIELAGLRLEAFVESEFVRLGAAVEVVEPITRKWEMVSFDSESRGDEGRWPVSDRTRQVRLESDVSKAGASRHLRVFVSESRAEEFPFAIFVNGETTLLELRFDDVHPALTLRAEGRVSTAVNRVLRELVVEAQAAIDSRGG